MFRGIYTAPPTENEGVQMIYLPDRQVIRMEGWYNGRQGTLQPVDMPLSEFLRGLGISWEECRQALEGTPAATAQAPSATAMQVPPTAPVTTEHTPRGAVETPVSTSSEPRSVVTQK
jgi:hypothetical protein